MMSKGGIFDTNLKVKSMLMHMTQFNTLNLFNLKTVSTVSILMNAMLIYSIGSDVLNIIYALMNMF